MKSMLRCPGCHTEFGSTTAKVLAEGVQCPACLTTIEVFNEDTWVPGNSASKEPLQSGDLQIPGYEIIGTIGQGGMGTVLEAKQASLGRRVAVKVLSASLAKDNRFVERFEREAAALASLSHPNIVTILERGRSAESVYFIMEYVEGIGGGAPTDLRSILNSRQLSASETKHFVTQVAKALAYSHEKGIVHRDIKPGNVMVDCHGNAKVADFGIASVNSQNLDSRLTVTSVAMGTLDYMAPEQRFDNLNVDQRADIYALGIMTYEMLTGKLPRGAFSPATTLAPGLDPQWDRLINSAMKPNPDERLGSMGQFLQSLDAVSTEFSSGAASTANPRTVAEPSVVVAEMVCHQCSTAIDNEAKYCPSCRSPQWLHCCECNSNIYAGGSFCPQCGAGIPAQLTRIKQLEVIQRELAAASDESLDLNSRCEHASAAGIAATRIARQFPKDENTAKLLGSANQLTLKLNARAARDAFARKSYRETLGYLDQILELDPANLQARKLSDKLTSAKLAGQEKARAYLAAGSPIQAIGVLEPLTRAFEGDADLEAQLTHCRAIQDRASTIVQSDIPRLISENRWVAVRNMLEELDILKVQVKGVERYHELTRSKLDETTALLRKAQAFLDARNFGEAKKLAVQASQVVTDHPHVQEFLERSKQGIQSKVDVVRKVHDAIGQRRWFLAQSILHEADAEDASLSSYAAKAKNGQRAADQFATLLRWCAIGITTLALMRYVTSFISENLRLPVEYSSFYWYVAVVNLLFVSLHGIAFLGLRHLVGRPIRHSRLLALASIWFIGLSAGTMGHQWLTANGYPSWLAWWWQVLCGTACTSWSFGLLFKDILIPSSRRFTAIVATGTLLMLLAIAALEYSDHIGRYLVSSLWLAALLVLFRISSTWKHLLPLVIAGAVVGPVVEVLANTFPDKRPLIQFAIPFGSLFGISVLMQNDRSRDWTILLGATTVLLVYFHEWLGDKAMETAWLAMTALIASEAGPLIDRRLHLYDRYRLRMSKSHHPTPN